MPKIKLFIEDVSKEQAERIQTELGNIAGCTVTLEEIKPIDPNARRFRKKPVVIEAVQVGPHPQPDWFKAARDRGDIYYEAGSGDAMIETLEGVMRARPGDWIIQGVKGEIYPCKPDIFEQTYEPVDTPIMAEMNSGLEEEMRKAMQDPGHITWLPASLTPGRAGVDPGPAVGDLDGRLPDIDADEPGPISSYQRFTSALAEAINANSMENGSDTPDYMLASFLTEVLQSYDRLMQERDRWYGGSHRRLKAQLEAEGSHTDAGDVKITELHLENDRLRAQITLLEGRLSDAQEKLEAAQSPVGWGEKKA